MSQGAVKEIQAGLDLVATVAYEEAKRLSGTTELEGMRLALQGVSPEGLDIEFLPDSDVEDLESFTVRVFVHLPSRRFLGFEFDYVFGMAEAHVVRVTRDAVRSALSDAIRVSAAGRGELDS